MSEQFAYAVGSTYASIGPHHQMRMPVNFVAFAFGDDELSIDIDCQFLGQRVEVLSVQVRRAGASVTPRDMTAIRLAELVHSSAWSFIRPAWEPVPDRAPRTISAIYWAHYATWGAPRRAVMDVYGVSRSTANRMITGADEFYGMPEGRLGGRHE